MSSLLRAGFTVMMGSAVLAVAPQAYAQNAASDADRRVQERITVQQRQVAVDDEGCVKYPANRDEIVVCGTRGQGNEHRIPGREDLESVRSTNNGIPSAPDVAGPGIFRGEPTISGCFLGQCPPPRAVETDYSKLPEVDPEYLERARAAEADERYRQRQQQGPKP